MERRTASWWTVSAIVMLATGCDPHLRTENRQVLLTTDLHSYDELLSGSGIVELSTACAERTGYRTTPDEPVAFTEATDQELRACYDEQLSGPARFDEGGCVVVEAPGEVAWDFVRQACELPDHFGDDRVVFDVLAISEVRGAFPHAVPLPTEVEGFEIKLTEEYRRSTTSEVGEPARVIEDTLRSIDAVVVRGDRPEMVAVSEPTMTAQPLAGSPSFGIDAGTSTTMSVDARAGDAFQVGMALPAGELDVGRVDVVARSEIASMELHPVMVRVADTDQFISLGAAAVTHDDQGRILWGPPVEWSVVEGDQPLAEHDLDEDGLRDPGPEASIADACVGASPGELRSVTLEGRVDGFRDTVRVEWDCVGIADDGCACRSGGAGERAWAGALGLLLFGLWQRRRRRGSSPAE